MKDVKEIRDIPNIENYLDYSFDFVLFDRADEIIIYECAIDSNTRVTIDFHSSENLIVADHRLFDLLTFEHIDFLQYTVRHIFTDKASESWCYRPLVKESEKNY